MDFKVAGTEAGITAIQMDIKIKGINEQILRTALAQAREGSTMSDFTTTWALSRLCLAYAVTWEIIVMNISFENFIIQAFKLLNLTDCAQSCSCQNLCLTTSENTTAVNSWQNAMLTPNWSDFLQSSSVWTSKEKRADFT